MKEIKKPRSWWYLAETISDADYADGLTLFENTPTQAESLQHNMEQAARGISLSINPDKT